MDRLSALAGIAACCALGGACEETKRGSAEPPSRVNAAKTGARQVATTEAFCDVHTADDQGPALPWPVLDGNAPAPGASGHWRWINAWATWCQPCVEEIPRLIAWRDKLAAEGTKLELVFVSMDESAADIAEYRKRHPALPMSLRFADPTKGVAWFKEVGLAGEPPIPIHVFVSPAGRVRCARAGGVQEQDFAVVKKLLGE